MFTCWLSSLFSAISKTQVVLQVNLSVIVQGAFILSGTKKILRNKSNENFDLMQVDRTKIPELIERSWKLCVSPQY